MFGHQRGFTLIELLVVIAIIGILSSVVLASLNTARDKAGDAAVKSNLETVRKQAELYFSTNQSYGTTPGSYYDAICVTNGTMFQLVGNGTAEQQEISKTIENAIQAAYSAGGGTKNCRLDANRQNYMVAIKLKSNSHYWCVDNLGSSKDIGLSLPASGILSC